MTIKKNQLIGGALGILVLFVIFSVFVLKNLNTIIKEAIEYVGTEMTGVEVSVGSVDIDTTSGLGVVEGITIANPKRFQAPYLLVLDRISVEVNVSTLTSDILEIRTVEIISPVVHWEGDFRGSNLDRVHQNVKRYTGKGEKREPSSPENRVIIDNLYITGAEVNISFKGANTGELTVPIPDIHLKDIGRPEGGTTYASVTQRVFDEMTVKVLKEIKSVPEFVGKAVEGLGRGLQKGIQGIFGN